MQKENQCRMTIIGIWYIGENKMTELIIYNILFWVPYILVCRLPEMLMQAAIDAA